MGRQRCSGCERPLSVCLCSQLPSPPLQTRTCVVVLQHPHEARHKLSTLPVLMKCLANCHVLQGRRFQAGCSPLLDSFFTHNTPNRHALLLFPTSSAQSISSWVAHQQQSCPCSPSLQEAGTLVHLRCHSDFPIEQAGMSTHVACDSVSHSQQAGDCSNVAHDLDSYFQHVSTSTEDSYSHHQQPGVDNYAGFYCQHTSTGTSSGVSCTHASTDSSFPHLVLIAVDATWQHANEMIKASGPYLNQFATPVCFPFDADQEGFGMANSELIIRKEPFKGCMTTLEAIASCLKVLEPNGVEIHEKLLSVLRSMVLFQASNIVSHKVRCTIKR